jgi:uncharacterized pyridoxamine 5'-phosphate oxidase family protein
MKNDLESRYSSEYPVLKFNGVMYRVFGMNIAEKEYIESEYKKYKSNFAFSVEIPAMHKDDTIYTLFSNSAEFVNDIQLDDVILDHNVDTIMLS